MPAFADHLNVRAAAKQYSMVFVENSAVSPDGREDAAADAALPSPSANRSAHRLCGASTLVKPHQPKPTASGVAHSASAVGHSATFPAPWPDVRSCPSSRIKPRCGYRCLCQVARSPQWRAGGMIPGLEDLVARFIIVEGYRCLSLMRVGGGEAPVFHACAPGPRHASALYLSGW